MMPLILQAPAAGWATPLSEVADEAFSSGMMGDGVALDPLEGVIRAPCDGVVSLVAATHHAVTLRSHDEVDVLIHVGLDTVALGGDGFEMLVEVGATVRTGDPLILIDLDRVAARARSLVTPILCLGEDLIVVRRVQGRLVKAGDVLLEVTRTGVEIDRWSLDPALLGEGNREAAERVPAAATSTALAPSVGVRRQIPQGESISEAASGVRRAATVTLAHGVHARPAGRIAAAAREFEAQVRLEIGERHADARSSVALMALALKFGDAVQVAAGGPDAEAAVTALVDMLESGMGEAPETPPLASKPRAAATVAPSPPPQDGVLVGATAAPGLAIGPAWRLAPAEVPVETASRGASLEQGALDAARATARAAVTKVMAGEHGARQAVLEAHLEFVDDPALVDAAASVIAAGASAGVAWRAAVQDQVQALKATGDPRMTERAADLCDVEARVLRALNGEADAGPAKPPAGAILLAEDLWPSQFIALDIEALAGICTARGGPTSHVAILAAAAGLPTLVAAGPRVFDIPDGETVVLDAEAGRLNRAPSPTELEAAHARLDARAARCAAARAASAEPAVTRDGTRVEVFANVGGLTDALSAAEAGAEGIGLLRTEFLFLDRASAPGEDEQAAAYQAVADAMGRRPVIVRTLDIGGDKPAPYLALPPEENPALGLRGVRVGLQRPQMLAEQLRAILRVRPLGVCRIMLPMVASLAELRQVRALLDAARADLGVEAQVDLGIMVETPAAAVTADLLAAEADFLSIGTNDLAQYVLALDRGHPQLTAGSDALHPAVLRMIARTCEGATARGRWTGVCGGLASDPLATPILLGLGVSELSCTPAAVPEIKAQVRDLSLADCRELARRALDLSSAEEVRASVRTALGERA